MALNFPGPYQADIFYSCVVDGVPMDHVMKLNVDCEGPLTPGQDFSTINFVTRDAGLTPGYAAILDWVDLAKAFYATTSVFSRCELWSVAPESFDRTFISAADIGEAGTHPQITSAAGQLIYTFRSAEGGVMRINFMETVVGLGVTSNLPVGDPNFDAVPLFVNSDANWILARDTSYPIAAIHMLPGKNERLFKVRYGR